MTLISTQNKNPFYPAFHNLIKRRWNTEKKESKLLSLIEAHKGYDLSPHLNKYEWNIVNLLKVHPLTVLKNVLYGNITAIQMATLYHFKNAYHQAEGRLEVVNLFINDAVSEKAKTLIQSTLFMDKEKTISHLDERELNELFVLMRQKPLSEQRFFIIPNRAPPENRTGNAATLSDALHEFGFEVFSNLPEKKWMVPSFAMMEVFGALYGKEGSIKIEPVIGFSTLRQIAQGMRERTRDFGFELEDKTITFDEVDGKSIEGPAHDFLHYHHQLLLPAGFLEAFGEMAVYLLDDAESAESKNKEWIHQTVQSITDIESFEFRKDDPGTFNWLPNRSNQFWFIFSRILDMDYENVSEHLITLNLKSLLYFLINNRSAWLSKYQIDVYEIENTSQLFATNNYESKSINLIASLLNSLKSL